MGCGPTVQPIPANSSRTTSMETEPTPGPMVVCTMASGKTTKWTAQASSHGLMDASTMATGAMASSTDSESTTRPAKKSRRENGMKESVSAGLSREMSQRSENHPETLNALLENDI